MNEMMFEDYDYEDVEVEYADYYEDDTYVMPDEESWKDDSDEQTVDPFTLDELYNYCIIPTITDSHKHLIGILSWSFLFLLSSRTFRIPKVLIHLSSTVSGGALLWHMFDWRSCLMGGLFVITYLNLLSSHFVLRRWRGPSCFIIGVIYLIVCEFWMVNPMWWHAFRGIQMVILMKLVSVGYDLDTSQLKEFPNLFEVTGYTFNPGTVIFGPWIPFTSYQNVLSPLKWGLKWVLKILMNLSISVAFLIFSTCLVNWLIPDNSNRWFIAYRDALSFRSSHYFVSYLSEVSLNLAGIESVSVSKPLKIEFPRSLVEVVIYWNTPMHHWLKTYVFKPSRVKFGPFAAIIFTYGMSALFHGLNFQIAAVLFSLGFYTYTEHMLREKLAVIFDACILARPCKSCKHRKKDSTLFCIFVNLILGLVTMFHLAYLGMMFDSSSQMQEKGYNAAHTLKKWSTLNYSSHWVAFFMYVLMAVL
ncbi:Protein-serine O-palmitoleoyltransferase porcupine [Armadillidium nasatum]|uniref:Protein-serine O-palmitoleoyltransferase porcupine n=1 Tax=Armadillidium nasatum TaxID=96803 RepID=A0A5N5SVP8_9CRUS|nr:Protein-serine O-palmitoleoyltransferase porcupine [Armadillidium nasatum]